MTNKILKKQKLRNNEYYNTQEMFDDLYDKSKNKDNYKFYKLMDLITNEQNIELAYRNIKKNVGSKTTGVNNHDIKFLMNKTNGDLTTYVKNRLKDYRPHKVRRVEISKDNGKKRPLGIPTIEDRLIQQCILQILEPICEAKFYKHNYGFRPNRSTHHAIARTHHLINHNKLYHVVDIDIKGFFDNVNHGKLLKQMWALGICDKSLLSVISKMLKAEIKGIGIPNKGTPQGGILSPLLSNIVLSELDWWIANQWEYFETKHKYSSYGEIKGNKHRALRKTKLKEIYIVRYADDFKIFCKDNKTANKIFYATKMWLKERLHLEISEEKSKIVNLKTNYSDYLGFKIKARDKGKKKVVKSHISDKSKDKIEKKLKKQIIKIREETTIENVNKYNSIILGLHNYYRVATHVNLDFDNISFKLQKLINNRTKSIRSKTGVKSKSYNKFYSKYNFKITYILGVALFPISGICTDFPKNFAQDICNYTKSGREKIHKKQESISTYILKCLMENPVISRSVEYNDNRISLYVGQNGICPISKNFLEIGNMQCHHKIPIEHGGTDEYSNLIFVKNEVHKVIHATNTETIDKYLKILNLDKNTLEKLNKLRTLVGNSKI
ncbi:MAG: group II intron reverse transcriptase/maturase [Peptostreptococcaceae bacterium]